VVKDRRLSGFVSERFELRIERSILFQPLLTMLGYEHVVLGVMNDVAASLC
jgi:hypothetical protein